MLAVRYVESESVEPYPLLLLIVPMGVDSGGEGGEAE